MAKRSRRLKDLSTGRTAVQEESEGVKVTVLTDPHPLKAEIGGRAFVLVKPLTVFVEEDAWVPIIGSRLLCDGGVLLAVLDDELSVALEGADPEDPLTNMLVPLIVRDIYLPPARVLAPLYQLRAASNLVGRDDGPRVSGEPKRCDHPFADPPSSFCPTCFWRW